MDNVELKPCPFCGGKAELDRIGNPLFSIRCKNIQCFCLIEKLTLKQAVEAWNNRV